VQDQNTVNHPEVIAEVSQQFLQYETALLANDVATLNDYFWRSPHTVRYGIAEHSYGIEAIQTYRAGAAPVNPDRQLRNTIITTFGRNMASVCTEFFVPGSETSGRQTQTWVRFSNGWKIVAAHVSTLLLAP
jgi:Protein of unknown function (DUF3225)